MAFFTSAFVLDTTYCYSELPMKKLSSLFAIAFFAFSFSSTLFGHCQVPCGVYTDQLRFDQMLEDHTTIEKATKLINELSGKNDAQSKNQLARWVSTKESHAAKIQKIVCEYFLIQRIKSSSSNYHKLLTSAHEVLVTAMKCKQTVDGEAPKALKAAILNLQKEYGKK